MGKNDGRLVVGQLGMVYTRETCGVVSRGIVREFEGKEGTLAMDLKADRS
jgi:hypothetical protein